MVVMSFVCQAKDGIRDLGRSRGLGELYKRQTMAPPIRELAKNILHDPVEISIALSKPAEGVKQEAYVCLLYTSDAADERSSVDLGGRRIIKKNTSDRCD